jgi:hypothetical protein
LYTSDHKRGSRDRKEQRWQKSPRIGWWHAGNAEKANGVNRKVSALWEAAIDTSKISHPLRDGLPEAWPVHPFNNQKVLNLAALDTQPVQEECS